MAQTLDSGHSAFTPALFASIYATGVRRHILGGQLVWAFLILGTFMFGASLLWLPERAEGMQLAPKSGDTEATRVLRAGQEASD
jgi:hypothetical protein